MERVREIIALMNLPSPEMIDGRLEMLADYWVNVEIRGRARIYKKKINRIKRVVYYETLQVLEWPNMDGSETFRTMQNLKLDRLDDKESSDNWIRQSNHEQQLEKARKEADRKRRDELLASIYEESELSANDIARCSAVEISDGRIRQIANDQANDPIPETARRRWGSALLVASTALYILLYAQSQLTDRISEIGGRGCGDDRDLELWKSRSRSTSTSSSSWTSRPVDHDGGRR